MLTLWKDLLHVKAGKAVYDNFGRATEEWIARPGNKERLADLLWVQQHCDGLFRAVIVVAKDGDIEPRELADCYPYAPTMRLVELNESTGEFRAASI